jgi:hypothetical protein
MDPSVSQPFTLRVRASTGQSLLQQAAAALRAGQWIEFTPANINAVTFFDPNQVPPAAASGWPPGNLNIFYDSPGHVSCDWFGRAVHDPMTKSVRWTGMGSGGTDPHSWRVTHQVLYDEAANAFSTKRALWPDQSSGHQYYHNLINVAGRRHYRRVSGNSKPSSSLYAWKQQDLDTGVWLATEIPPTGSSATSSPAEFWPRLGTHGSILELDQFGTVKRYDIGSVSGWTSFATGLGAYVGGAMFLQPNADDGNGILVLGSLTAPYPCIGLKRDASAVVLKDLPWPADLGGTDERMGGSKLSVDPLSTKVLMFARDGLIYEASTETGIWVQRGPITPEVTYGNGVMVCVPCYLPSYGVHWFLKPATSPSPGSAKGFLYKHG